MGPKPALSNNQILRNGGKSPLQRDRTALSVLERISTMRTVSKKSSRSFPSKKIRSVVQSVLPKGRKFRLQVLDSKIGNMKIVRVVTPAWKTLSPSERIHKLILAANEELTRDEIKNIL